MTKVKRALVSVSDKAGVVEFARALGALGVEIISTGGTAKLLQKEGVAVTEVSAYTGFAEMLDGRVKTLHPKIHGGLLARRDDPTHLKEMRSAGIEPIDLLVVNLYPFPATVADPDHRFEDAIENIDIGGPAMLRSAAKNHAAVAALVDPADYARVLQEIRQEGAVSEATRFGLAAKVFAHTAAYDGAIANYLTSLDEHRRRLDYAEILSLQFCKVDDLRYGENPHQSAAFYRDAHPVAGSLAQYRQLQGKELSYNNIADADAAWECVKSFTEPACVIVKHANPCGVATGVDSEECLRVGVALRSGLGLRRHPRLQPRARPRHCRGARQAVRRGDHRAAHRGRCAEGARREGEPAPARGTARRTKCRRTTTSAWAGACSCRPATRCF